MVEEKANLAGTNTGNLRLRHATDQISSLIFLSHSTKVFSSKWKVIRSKLDEILSILASLPQEIQASADNHPTLSGIIRSIKETTDCSTNLAQKCIEHSYSGKLLMQSDLDIIFVKFDSSVKSLSEFINSEGLLSNGNYAIVVSRPPPAASRDDIQFYVKDLLCRFKIGRIEMKKQALKSKFKKEALKSVATLSGFDSYKSVLVGTGVISPLIRVLETGSDLGKELSTRCLMKVTANSDNAWSVSAHGGASALLKICGSGCDDAAGGELVGLACGVLRNLIGVDEIKRFVVEEGAIPMSIKLVKSKNEASQISAIDFIQVLASGNEFIRGLIVNEGGIRVLVRVLDPKSSYSSKSREKSMRALIILCSDSIGYINSLKNYNFIDHLLYFLKNGEVSIQESALRAAFLVMWVFR
ncbi:unnamed protein product [Lactuca virosa]|uniref:DUF7032 domain-containing protein n=1 Tax=Lactuca virosa TaxID=75947 RepID=A0AAU9LMP6_9ASTR|nr:unnamed protein product [Lactuca virosa]